MLKILDIKSLHKLIAVKIERGHLSIRFFDYKNVIGISSKLSMKKDEHVLFGDYEKKLTEKRLNMIKEVMKKRDIPLMFIFKSSKDRYHLISPKVFSWLDAINTARELDIEKNYLSISSVRQEFILRISKKGSKDEPELIKVLQVPSKKAVFSFPHCKFLSLYAENYEPLLNSLDKIGGKLYVESYRTTAV